MKHRKIIKLLCKGNIIFSKHARIRLKERYGMWPNQWIRDIKNKEAIVEEQANWRIILISNGRKYVILDNIILTVY